MPTTPKSNRRGHEHEKSRKNKLKEKSSSFHGKLPSEPAEARMRRPNTFPDLLGGKKLEETFPEVRPSKLTKLLLNVTIQGSVGAIQVLISPESTVGGLIAIAVQQYTKERRRPIIASDASRFDLHYSQFSLESLDRNEKLMALGSRNFFLCAKKAIVDGGNANGIKTTSSASCSKQAEEGTKNAFPWLRFLDFLG
uniref:Uncharacterized protein MANES_11G156800 n=1 Tax=Rhizophora mucronata TaxID=61149 RepID=A0A2P2JJL1_RHIMU